MKETICWHCQKATGNCPWSSNLKPIEGWEAKKTIIHDTTIKNYNSYKILKCPEFLEDINHQKIINFSKKMNMSESLVNELLSDNILNYSDLNITSKSLIRRKILFRRMYGK